MNAITTKLRNNVMDGLIGFADDLEKSGMPQYEILRFVDKYINFKKIEFYRKPPAKPIEISATLSGGIKIIKTKMDSKAESIFYEMLEASGIGFKFQYKIGPYRVDYIVGDDLVVELDGPHHLSEKQKVFDKTRDSYLKRLGYRILRIPIWAVSISPKVVIDEIREQKGD